jgi:hypothetical protein
MFENVIYFEFQCWCKFCFNIAVEQKYFHYKLTRVNMLRAIYFFIRRVWFILLNMQGRLKIFGHSRRKFSLPHQHATPCLKTPRLQYIPFAVVHFPVISARCSNKSTSSLSLLPHLHQKFAGLTNNQIEPCCLSLPWQSVKAVLKTHVVYRLLALKIQRNVSLFHIKRKVQGGTLLCFWTVHCKVIV